MMSDSDFITEDEEEEDDSLLQASGGGLQGGRSGGDDVDELLEICVESLVGTVFEMRLSKRETIHSIKMRLQRLEGIPKHHMHILYRGTELEDSSTLSECRVENGATLRLILALRGGPINTRRIPMPPSAQHQSHHHQNFPQELQEIMLKNKEQLMDKMPRDGQVTVLLFREGDKLNLYHVLEKPDGSFSPLSDRPEDLGQEDKENHLERTAEEEERLRQNAVTMNKMMEIRGRMEGINQEKKRRQQHHRRRSKDTSGAHSASKGHRQRQAGNGKKASDAKHRPKSGNNNNNTHGRRKRSISQRKPHQQNDRSVVAAAAGNGNSNGAGGVSAALMGASLTSSVPLPPINGARDLMAGDDLGQSDLLVDLNNSVTTSSILPIHPNFSRQSSTVFNNSLGSTTANGANNNNNLPNLHDSVRMQKQKTTMKTVPEWLRRNETPARSRKNSQAKHHGDIFDDDNQDALGKPSRPDIDVLDLKLKPDEAGGVEILRRRRTQKLISTDINELTGHLDNPVKGAMMTRPAHGSKAPRQRRTRRQTSSLTSLSGPEDNTAATAAQDPFSKSKISLTDSNASLKHFRDLKSSSGRSRNTFLADSFKALSADTKTDRRRRRPLGGTESPAPSLATLIDNLKNKQDPLNAEDIEDSENEAFIRENLRLNRNSSVVVPLVPSKTSSARSDKNNNRKPQTSSSRKSSSRGQPRRSSAGYRPASRASATARKKPRTPRPRCANSDCRKKLNITNGFPCRCQKVFCAKHRHPESHSCTFDYKEEGRRLLEEANPLVTFPKLPKI